MDEIDMLIRGAAIGILLLIAAKCLRAEQRINIGWVGALYAAGAIGYLLWGHPGVTQWPQLARLLVGVLALSTPFFFWTLTRLIFEDGFSLRPSHWALLCVIVAVGVAQAILPGIRLPWLPGSLRLGFRFVSLALIIHAFWVVWSGWTADLVEKRAQFRLVFLVGTGIVAALVVLAALFYGPAAQRPMPARLAEAAGLLAVSLGLANALMRLNDDFLPPEKTNAPASPFAAKTNPANTVIDPEPDRDADDLARLETLMRKQEAWRETGLTVGGLAARAAIPEYRLRRVINQQLGYRNFTAFLNEYRLSAAASLLADRDQLRVPVLTIALDLGWGSIGPFNRAFRGRFGMTPTDYRRTKMTLSGPNAQSRTDS
jgi:AraC-like DNA-binding protein